MVWLYGLVGKLGYVKTVRREGRIIGVISGIGKWILTLAVEPEWQRQGIGGELVKGRAGRLYVYTKDDAAGFYQKMGFEKVAQLGGTVFLWRK